MYFTFSHSEVNIIPQRWDAIGTSGWPRPVRPARTVSKAQNKPKLVGKKRKNAKDEQKGFLKAVFGARTTREV